MQIARLLVAIPLLSTISLAATIYVPDDHPTIQDAINGAADGDSIIVRAGTYVERIDFLGKTIALQSEAGPKATVIDGSQAGSVVTFQTGEEPDSVIDGFFITNGTGTTMNMGGTDYTCGGGIFCHSSSPTIINNIVSRNQAVGSSSYAMGGGIMLYDSSSLVAHNTISRNVVPDSPTYASYGGGLACWFGAPTVTNNELDENRVFSWYIPGGEAVYCHQSDLIFTNNSVTGHPVPVLGAIMISLTRFHIADNTVQGNGSGIYCERSAGTITGNRILDGGSNGISSWNSRMLITSNMICDHGVYGINLSELSVSEIVNNTIFSTEFGNIYCIDSDATVKNTIVRGDIRPNHMRIAVGRSTFSSTLTISHSNVEDGQATVYVESGCTLNWGNGMIDADPLFVDPAVGDYHIPFDSPCRSAGDRNAANLPERDFEGDPRTGLFAFPDIGADEFHRHLYVIGKVSNGSAATGVIIGWPKTNPVMLISGTGALSSPHPTTCGDFWLKPPWDHRIHLDPIPDNGVKLIHRVVATSLPPGTEIPLQALVGTELSNLWVVEIE